MTATIGVDEVTRTITMPAADAPDLLARATEAVRRGRLALDADPDDPDAPARIPTVEFGDFERAPHLGDIAQTLIDEAEELDHLAGARLRWYWKKKATRSGGVTAFGRVQAATGILAMETGADFTVWLAADLCREARLTNRQVEAAVWHELAKLGVDEEKGTYFIRRPDFAGFFSELERYGAWWEGLRGATDAFRQARLFDEAA